MTPKPDRTRSAASVGDDGWDDRSPVAQAGRQHMRDPAASDVAFEPAPPPPDSKTPPKPRADATDTEPSAASTPNERRGHALHMQDDGAARVLPVSPRQEEVKSAASEYPPEPVDAPIPPPAPSAAQGRRRIYVASSWRNPEQPLGVEMFRQLGHEVYDFRNPRPGDTGFAWSEIDPDWLGWKPAAFRELLESHPVAYRGFMSDFKAMEWADTFVLMLPSGRSAHLEAGWAIGKGKPTAILLHEDKFEPELMYLMADRIAVTLEEVCDWLDGLGVARAA